MDVIPVSAQPKTGTHAHLIEGNGRGQSPTAAYLVFIGPGQALRAFRDDTH